MLYIHRDVYMYLCICIDVYKYRHMYIYTYSLHMYLYIYKRRYIKGRYQKIYKRITKGNDGEKMYEEEKGLSFLIN